MEDYTWWTYRFSSDPLLGELKYIGNHPATHHQKTVAQTGGSVYFFDPIHGIIVITPEGFDVDSFSHHALPTLTNLNRLPGCFHRGTGQSYLGYSTTYLWVMIDNAWYSISGPAASLLDVFEFSATKLGVFGHAVGAASGSSQTLTTYYAEAVGTLANSGTGGILRLAGWRPEEGALASIEKITVEFSGVASTSAFSVRAGYIHNGTEVAATSNVIGSLSSAGVVNGLNRFVIHPTRLPMASGFTVELYGIGNCSIHEVIVEYSVQSQETATNQLVA